MSGLKTIDYERIAKENLGGALARRELHKVLNNAIKDSKNGSVILLEVPAEGYAEANASSVEFLLDNGYEGVYMSFQRPFNNLSGLFTRQGIDMNRLFVIDCATGFSGAPQEINPRCVNISPELEIDDIVKAVYGSLSKLKSKKRFVFVDSLTTMALYEPLSETMRFSEAVVRKFRDKGFEDVKLLFNVEKDLTQKRYIESVSLYADEHIHLGLCT